MRAILQNCDPDHRSAREPPPDGQTYPCATRPGAEDPALERGPSLLLEPLDRLQIHRPVQRRAAPVLPGRAQFGALADGADAEAVFLRAVAGRGGVDGRAAIPAEGMRAPGPAFRRLDVDRRLPREQRERAIRRGDGDTEGGAGEGLAIRAVAEPHAARIDLRRIGDGTAVAGAVDFHGRSPWRCSMMSAAVQPIRGLSIPMDFVDPQVRRITRRFVVRGSAEGADIAS